MILNFGKGMLKMANELLEYKIICWCIINFWIGWQLFWVENVVRGSEFFGETWAVVGQIWNLVDFHGFLCVFSEEICCSNN